MNEPCRMCGHLPILANYYDFYRFHCPTPGCPYHLGEWTILNGKGRWYGSIDDARDAWNTRQRRGEATSAPQTIEPEPEPASAEDEPQNGLEQSDSGTAEAETSQVPELDADRTCPNAIGQVSIDTREKLEEDVEEWSYHSQAVFPKSRKNKIIGWLDRQAAITERELCKQCEWPNLAAQPDQEAYDRIAELTAERDEAYRRGYDDGLHANTRAAFAAAEQAFGDESAKRFEGGVIKSQAQRIRELEAERDHLRKVVKQQADSFAKLERELHDLNSGEELNALRASVAGLKSTVEKQAETIDNQRDELSRFNAESHGKKRIPKGIRWPRHEDGKLVKICGLDAMTVKFDKTGCTIDYGFDQTERMSYDEIRGRERI